MICQICGVFISETDAMLYDSKCYDCQYNPYADQEQAEENSHEEV